MTLSPRERRLLALLAVVAVAAVAFLIIRGGGAERGDPPSISPSPSVAAPAPPDDAFPQASPSFVIPTDARDPFTQAGP